MKFRPEADIFPMMNTEELKDLAADIDKHGQQETVKLYEGDILDGRNRWTAITEHGKVVQKPRTEVVKPESPIAYVISENEKRRHMTPSQRSYIAAAALPFFEEEAKKRKVESGRVSGRGRRKVEADLPQSNREPQSRDMAAKAFGSSGRAVGQSKRIIDHGSARLNAAVKAGDISVDRAEKIVKKAPDSKREQDDLLRAVSESKQSTRVKSLTGEVEWYTPVEYLEAAKEAMGGIDLDPASSENAQARVKARKFYTVEDDGLEKPWFGNVFLNPPYRMPLIRDFVARIVEMYEDKDIRQGILLTNNATDTEWFLMAAQAASAFCCTRGRINFVEVRNGQPEQKTNPTNGQTFFYFGSRVKTFCRVFSKFGAIYKMMEPFDGSNG